MIVLDKNRIVSNMHQAYERIKDEKYKFEVKNLGRLQRSRLVLLELPALPRQTETDVHNKPGQLGPVPLLEPRVDAEEHAVKQ